MEQVSNVKAEAAASAISAFNQEDLKGMLCFMKGVEVGKAIGQTEKTA